MSVPATGEGISVSTLSVETSRRGSSRATSSPSCFSQRVTVPSVTDSPRAGIFTVVPSPEPPPSPDAVGAGSAAGCSCCSGSACGAGSACGLRLGRLLAALVAGLRDGVAVGLVGDLVARAGALVGLLATGVATGRGRAVADDREVGADRNRVVLLDEDLLQRAGHRRGDLGVDLVGRDLEQRLVDLDAVADTLEPARHGPFGDGLAERRHLHAF